MRKINYSFKQWCIDTNNESVLELWDYKLNNVDPDEVAYKSNVKYWFKCPRGIHESSEHMINTIVKSISKGKLFHFCNKCTSFAQYIIDQFGEEYLTKIWSDKNIHSPCYVQKCSKSKVWLKCENDSSHPDYEMTTDNYGKGKRCPYCSGKKICKTNSLGYLYPKSIDIWSEKNDTTPFNYTAGTKQKAWFKCDNRIHEDYERRINLSVEKDFKCPLCGSENQIHLKGEAHPYWKGDLVKENNRIRWSTEYKGWRTNVYEKDFYTCQCCGVHGGNLNVHHLKDFANYPDLRFDVSNAIVLCENCHDSTIEGSFHNLYGTHGKTESELQEYINNKRKQLGINIPFDIDEYKNGNILMPHDETNESFGKWIFNVAAPSQVRFGGNKILNMK